MESTTNLPDLQITPSPYAFLLFFEQYRALILRLLWQSPANVESLQAACNSSRPATLELLRLLAQQKLIVEIVKTPTEGSLEPYSEFAISFPPDAKSEINEFLGLYDPPLKGIDLRGSKYMSRYKECQESLSRVFEWELEAQGGLSFSWRSLIRVADFVGLPIKTCCQFLEYMEKIKPLTWDRMEMKHGLTPKQLRENAEF